MYGEQTKRKGTRKKVVFLPFFFLFFSGGGRDMHTGEDVGAEELQIFS